MFAAANDMPTISLPDSAASNRMPVIERARGTLDLFECKWLGQMLVRMPREPNDSHFEACSICRALLGRGTDGKQILLELGTLRCNCVVIPFDDFAIAQEEHADPVPRLETEILEMVYALVENHRPARANVSSTSNRTTLCKNPLILSLTAWCPFAGSWRSDIQ